MKKNINGVVYDTKDSRNLGGYRHGSGEYHIAEELYVTKSGRFFMYCRGGPMTPYNSYRQGKLYPGRRILMVTRVQAQEWAEHTLSPNQYIELFAS